MKNLNKSYFKNKSKSQTFINRWVSIIESQNKCKYEKFEVDTSLGKSIIYGINTEKIELQSLIIFPGYRTSSLFWDLDNNLKIFKKNYRIYLIETNGQPNLSDGYTPNIKSLEYGHWANEVITKLNIETTFIAGASFGALICMKLALVVPEKIKACFLLNPACFSFFSLLPKNLYYNLLPVLAPSITNIKKFINAVIFFKPKHSI